MASLWDKQPAFTIEEGRLLRVVSSEPRGHEWDAILCSKPLSPRCVEWVVGFGKSSFKENFIWDLNGLGHWGDTKEDPTSSVAFWDFQRCLCKSWITLVSVRLSKWRSHHQRDFRGIWPTEIGEVCLVYKPFKVLFPRLGQAKVKRAPVLSSNCMKFI